MINLYIVDYFNIERANGLSTYVNTLAKGIASHKEISLHYIWINSTGYKCFEKSVEASCIHYYIPRHIAEPNNTSNYDLMVADFLAQEMAFKNDVIVHFNWINHCPLAYLLKRKVKCKILLTKHCIPWRDFIVGKYPLFLKLDNIFNLQKQKYYKTPPFLVRERICYNAVDHIICVTEYAKRELLDLFHYPPGKISVVHNGLQENILLRNKLDKAQLRAQYGFEKDEKIILFAGNVDQRKGVWDLLKAFEALETGYKEKKLRLLIAGPGKHSQVLSMIKRAWAKVTFTGNIDKEALYDLYFIADIGIVPSYVEQCSYTTIEMMFAGLPVIVSDVDGLKEIVPDDCGLKLKLILGEQNAFIDPDDLKQKICFYMDHVTEAKEYAGRARKHALQNFRADQMINKTISVYEILLDKNRSQKTNKLTSKNGPLVSILLPCYNAEKYIRDCLKSILEQTYSNFEIVLIDDGSTDRTAAVIHQMRDLRIRCYKNSTNKGIEYSRNKIASLADGKYIACIDADDMMHPDRLLKQLTYLEQNPSIAMVGSWHYVIDQFGRAHNIQEYPLNDRDIRLLMLFRNPFSHPSVMMRESLLKEFKYSDDYKYCEDYGLWFKIASGYQVANIPEYLTFYRIHNDSTSGQYLKQQKQNVMELLSDELEKSGIHPSVQEMVIHAAICYGYGRRYFNTPEKIKALRKWVDKVLSSFAEKNHYDQSYVKRMTRIILLEYCGIESELTLEQNPDNASNKPLKDAQNFPL